ncbi:hypothetical protein CO051_01390 [Candidatus Roizmanbacteria bacterium CG_4_9_14_0_2_um_filter_39_13]|uniref:Uncharacterized protein n=2 Tax=Candidatus Roizmaniibacteriota TaxID=1752723 RepID=A0A2M8F2L5_9BACT|nr:MAG: hypothetical protein CO051_01390 [Candidatus Roizmanbacteria bacterium CG_4_9_14_0_2_um_filter_39_13]PJE62206.1 MAG: hypothetical protein COU87_00475 [Candidatus Roizmanbacteria bacterium CG10_big_fil_rev_8_21_14_0_10_39_12]
MDKQKEKKSDQVVKPSKVVYFKVFFLTAIVIFGLFVLNNLASKQNQDESDNPDGGVQGVFSSDDIRNALDKEIRTNNAYKLATSEFEKTTSNVLGEATRIKDDALDQGKEFVTDYVYERTVSSTIENMINRLPERQKEKIVERICK